MSDLEHLHCVVCGGELVPDDAYRWYRCAKGHTVHFADMEKAVIHAGCVTKRTLRSGAPNPATCPQQHRPTRTFAPWGGHNTVVWVPE